MKAEATRSTGVLQRDALRPRCVVTHASEMKALPVGTVHETRATTWLTRKRWLPIYECDTGMRLANVVDAGSRFAMKVL